MSDIAYIVRQAALAQIEKTEADRAAWLEKQRADRAAAEWSELLERRKAAQAEQAERDRVREGLSDRLEAILRSDFCHPAPREVAAQVLDLMRERFAEIAAGAERPDASASAIKEYRAPVTMSVDVDGRRVDFEPFTLKPGRAVILPGEIKPIQIGQWQILAEVELEPDAYEKIGNLLRPEPARPRGTIRERVPCPDCAHTEQPGFYAGLQERDTCRTCDGSAVVPKGGE